MNFKIPSDLFKSLCVLVSKTSSPHAHLDMHLKICLLHFIQFLKGLYQKSFKVHVVYYILKMEIFLFVILIANVNTKRPINFSPLLSSLFFFSALFRQSEIQLIN